MTRLKVDIDRRAFPRDFTERMRWTMATLGWRVEWWSVYRTRNGWHVEINIRNRVSVSRVIAAQAILGSDPRRETFNLARTAAWRYLGPYARSRWNVLFTRKVVLNRR